ncbi:hypothetical protein PCANC_00904 [Puccinia coronata f. sp. avenae]|uniref:No apical meristem-associated C-terminal domain-containing protein n=1 Tax=Puccinia coronata f. sp. avenae TaxID=200324 RepID=A0A2N5W7H4_9BASI|nr:hypothetical protein PCANC_00904 [Puccinia coronata f. sp. avenae]
MSTPPVDPLLLEINKPEEEDKLSTDQEDQKAKTSRAPNYKDDEDVQICESWLAVTQDPLNSTNQSGDTFWTRVAHHYMSKIPSTPRSFFSLKSRWSIIQRTVNKFNGCYRQIVNANQSGASHNDRLSAALKLYCKTEGKPFTRLQCFNILVNAEKWNAYCADLELKNTATKKLASNADSPALVMDLSSEVTPSDATSEVTVVPASSEPGQPIGNRKAKQIKQEDGKSAKWKEDMLTVQQKLAAQNDIQNQILAKQKDAMQTLAEESIMNVDISTISESRRPYYEWKQKQIMARVAQEQERDKMKQAKEQTKAKGENENETGQPSRGKNNNNITINVDNDSEEGKDEDDEDEDQ